MNGLTDLRRRPLSPLPHCSHPRACTGKLPQEYLRNPGATQILTLLRIVWARTRLPQARCGRGVSDSPRLHVPRRRRIVLLLLLLFFFFLFLL